MLSNAVMLGDEIILGDAVMLGAVAIFDDVLIALGDGNVILHFKMISRL